MKYTAKIAIFMPVYNAEKFIEDAIDSVLMQTEQDFLLVIGNDCSTDLTLKKIKPFLDRDPRIILLNNQKNLGQNRNFNKMLDFIYEEINCEYVAFFAGDDLMHKNRLLKQEKFMDEMKDVIMCFCSAKVLNYKNAYSIAKKFVGVPKNIKKEYDFDYLIKKDFPFVTTGAFVKKKGLEVVRYSQKYASDLYFFIEIAMRYKKKIGFLNEVLASYRRHDQGVTSMIKNKDIFICTVLYYLDLVKIYPQYKLYVLLNFISKIFWGGMRFINNKILRRVSYEKNI